MVYDGQERMGKWFKLPEQELLRWELERDYIPRVMMSVQVSKGERDKGEEKGGDG